MLAMTYMIPILTGIATDKVRTGIMSSLALRSFAHKTSRASGTAMTLIVSISDIALSTATSMLISAPQMPVKVRSPGMCLLVRRSKICLDVLAKAMASFDDPFSVVPHIINVVCPSLVTN